VAYADVLRGLRALFALGEATSEERAQALSREAPGLAPAEREALLGLPADRVSVYANLVRENQATMLRFVARAATAALVRFCGVPEAEVARATLFDTPRRTGRMRELSARLLDHLRGAGRAWTERCPAVLDLALLEQAYAEAFYAEDDPGALDPVAFDARLSEATVDQVLALECRAPTSVRRVRLDHDVLAWRDAWVETGAFPEPVPPREDAPVEALVTRDPRSLQPRWHRLDPALVEALLPPSGNGWRPLESLAEAWVAATGADPQDDEAAARFLEQTSRWVSEGLLAVRDPAGGAGQPAR
jgi:hypothetical protein